jgi:putative nucleotidyltransferase with HDIG domain
MHINYKEIQKEARDFVSQYFSKNDTTKLIYHNLNHTKEVLKAAEQIANHYQLNDKDYFIVFIAALFHDTGYFEDPKNHEFVGARNATQFLLEKGVNEEVRNAVSDAIQSTKLPQSPKNLIEEIICDADLFHLGTESCKLKSKLLHKEIELFCNKDIKKGEWNKMDVNFLESHTYHTDYCRLLLNDQKLKNLNRLKSKLAETSPKTSVPDEIELLSEISGGKKKDKPERGIETMFRITSANNQRLSDMADNKAHILITVNSIILSLVVSLLLRKLDNNSFLIIPTLILLIVSLSCVVVSILSTRPSIPNGVFTDDDLKNKSVNLLFFGNFYKMPLVNYTKGMVSVMNDNEFLYGTLIRDVYSQGVVLGRKYKLIRLAYNIFMFGLILSVVAFVIAYLGFDK